MTRTPVVSVVIPTRNRAATLDRAVASIVEPVPATPFEIVVVDNASEDETSEVLARWTDREPRIRAVREDEVGAGPALRTGTAAAVGSLLLFTDDDVVVDRGWVDAYVAFFERRPAASVAGGPIRPLPRTGSWPTWFSERAAPALGQVLHDGERPLVAGEHVWGANMAARASVLERIGGWRADLGVRDRDHPTDPGLNQDVELQYRARDRGEAVWFCPDARVGHLVDERPPGWLLRRAFLNGRNARHRRPWPGMPVAPVRAVGSAAAIATWGANACGVIVDALAFRTRPRPPRFERAWLRAWRLGWSFEDAVTDGQRRFDAVVQAVSRSAIGIAERLAGRS